MLRTLIHSLSRFLLFVSCRISCIWPSAGQNNVYEYKHDLVIQLVVGLPYATFDNMVFCLNTNIGKLLCLLEDTIRVQLTSKLRHYINVSYIASH